MSCRRAQRDCWVSPLRGQPGLSPKAALLFPGCSSLVSASPPFSDLQLSESLLCPEVHMVLHGFKENQAEAVWFGGLFWSPWKPLRATSALLHRWHQSPRPDSRGQELGSPSKWESCKVTLRMSSWDELRTSLDNTLCHRSTELKSGRTEFKFSFLIVQLLESYRITQSLFPALWNKI